MEASIFTQDVEPQGWDPALYGHAEWPMNVLLVDKLPSAHQSLKNYKVAGLNIWFREFISFLTSLGVRKSDNTKINCQCIAMFYFLTSDRVGNKLDPIYLSLLQGGNPVPAHQPAQRLHPQQLAWVSWRVWPHQGSLLWPIRGQELHCWCED